MFKLQFVSAVFLLFVAVGLAAPNPLEAAAEVVYHCANGVDTCPNAKWTCCGPILAGVGGTCRKLAPGEVCAL